MKRHRKNYSVEFKARVAVQAGPGQKTTPEIAARPGVHPNQVSQRKKQAWRNCPGSFPLAEREPRKRRTLGWRRWISRLGN